MNAIFKGKAYGAVTVGERGQLVIPAELRKDFNIKPGGRLMVFANVERRLVTLMTEKDFSEFLERASKAIVRLEGEVPAKRRKR